ncbi:4-(cytidine 5'-diphospho)-2-C-methyl-D-erythritol kinase [Brucellaceae bacterium C25G]
MTITAPTFETRVVSRLAPVKINLALHVIGKLETGYHELQMIVAFGDFGDNITVHPSAEDQFTVSGYYAPLVPLNQDNLVLKARDLLRLQAPEKSQPVHIHLEKKMPVAAGIGGGSADAAAVLSALNTLWQLEIDQQKLYEIGLKLGADVPMCLHSQQSGAPLFVEGIGEELTILDNFPKLNVLLINDGTALATPDIFKALQKRDNPPLAAMPSFNSTYDVCAYLKDTRNDLFQPAQMLAPQLEDHLNTLSALGADFVQMSGSGATCFAIFDDAEVMEEAKHRLRHSHPEWFVVSTRTYGSGKEN